MKFEYCPICGNKLILKKAGDDGFIPFCKICNRFWFDLFPTCVIVLIANQYDEVVLLRQSYLSDKYSTFVAGYMQPGESAEDATRREIKEEIGLEISDLRYVTSHWFNLKQMLMIGFIAKTNKKNFKLSEEVDSAEWVPIEKIPEKIYPEHPDNIAYVLYREYLMQKNKENV